jgi:hypothetical protein
VELVAVPGEQVLGRLLQAEGNEISRGFINEPLSLHGLGLGTLKIRIDLLETSPF